MIDYVSHVREDAERLAVAARAAGLDTPVPSCPGWTVRDLVGHTGVVHLEKERIVRERRTEPPPEMQPPDDGLIDWFGEGAAALVATLAATDPATPMWTWHDPEQTAGFWRRRMAHETLIHRVDAELAAGSVGPVDEDLARDGIDEILVVMMSSAPSWATVTPGEGAVAVVTQGSAWTIRRSYLSGTSPNTGTLYEALEMAALTIGPVAADCTLRGSAADLDLWLWGRAPLDVLDVHGDRDLALWLRGMAAEDTQ